MGERESEKKDRHEHLTETEVDSSSQQKATEISENVQEDDYDTMRLPRRSMLEGINVKRDLASLRIDVGDQNAMRTFQLDEAMVRIGRSPDCELQLDLLNISREHARIVYENEEYAVEDLNSTNGTLLNGLLVSKSILRNGDVIEIGEAKLTFTEEGVAG